MSKYRTKDERYRASLEYLTQIKRLESRVDSLRERRTRYRDMATMITPRYSSQPSGGGNGESRQERYAVKLLELEEEMRARGEEYVELVREAERAISALPDRRWRDVLTYHYVNGWTIPRVARAMNYARETVYRLHAEAMVHFKPPAPPKF